jgi:predicted RND superfamily exporter protein
MAKLLTVIIVSLSLLLGSCATRVQSKADGNAKVEDKHEKMSMEELQKELIKLRTENIVADREYRNTQVKCMEANRAYRRALEKEDGEIDTLFFRKLEADASKALAKEVLKKIYYEFKVAQKQYIELLMAEQRTN